MVNASLMSGLSLCVASLAEKVLPLLKDQSGAVALLHEIEQLQSHIRDLQPALDLARKEIED